MSTQKHRWYSWSLSDDELKEQVENYSSLSIAKSYRGLSVLITLCLLGLSLILGAFNVVSIGAVIYSLVIYIPLLFFVYRGHRWAIIGLIILWTIEKGIQLTTGAPVVSIIVWWLVVIPYFVKTLKVENARREAQANVPANG